MHCIVKLFFRQRQLLYNWQWDLENTCQIVDTTTSACIVCKKTFSCYCDQEEYTRNPKSGSKNNREKEHFINQFFISLCDIFFFVNYMLWDSILENLWSTFKFARKKSDDATLQLLMHCKLQVVSIQQCRNWSMWKYIKLKILFLALKARSKLYHIKKSTVIIFFQRAFCCYLVLTNFNYFSLYLP